MPRIASYLKCSDKDKNMYGNVVQNLNVTKDCNDTKKITHLSYIITHTQLYKRKKERKEKYII